MSEVPGTPAIRGTRPGDVTGAEEFANLLARAVRQFRTYPPTSPRCEDAVTACHQALTGGAGDGQLLFRVHPRELIVGDTAVGTGTIIEQELARRLHRAHVAALSIDASASPRELSRFCRELTTNTARATSTLAETLTERGVDRIVPVMARRPEVLDLGLPGSGTQDLVALERQHAGAIFSPNGPAAHLYPPDRGWVRLDPSVALGTVSLTDLAILTNDPGDLATMLLRLTNDDPNDPRTREAALEQKFSDVTVLFEALNPQLARMMFSRLAGAVLALDNDRRTALLRRTILPGLLDGRVDGQVLKDFPDPDLAESLCLLLDLETAAPELLTTALDRLDLATERRQAVAPLLEEQVRQRHGKTSMTGWRADGAVDHRTRRLVQVEAGSDKCFVEFASFELSMDHEAVAGIGRVVGGIRGTDPVTEQLQCLSNLVRLQPNPTLVEVFLGRAQTLLSHLARESRWQEAATWIASYRHAADDLRESRPDVAEAVSSGLVAFFTGDRVAALLALHESNAQGQELAANVMLAPGPAVALPLIELLEASPSQAEVRWLTELLCSNAAVLASVIGPEVGRCSAGTARVLVRALGFAGPGYEQLVGAHLAHEDGTTSREALRGLARIATADAAALVAEQIDHGQAQTRRAAEDTLWHFPAEHATPLARQLLLRKDFVRHNPKAAGRLLDRAGRATPDGLRSVLVDLVPLRFRIWNPSLVRVGLKARRMLAQ